MTIAPVAEAVFGSVSRGRSDRLSDRDILLVGDKYSALSDRAAELKADGWSVACYTWAKLNSLSQNGALFIQHLKDEAEIVIDEEGRLRKLLAAFQPKASYRQDILPNFNLCSIAALRPSTQEGALWSADIVYVSLRNFGILYLASQKKYVFDFIGIVDELIAQNVIPAASKSDIVRLRMAKALYRAGERVSVNSAERMLNEAIRWLPTKWFPHNFVAWSPMRILHAATALASSAPSYHRLRNLERNYIALRSVAPQAAESPQAQKLLRWIENPRSYAAVAGRAETETIAFLREAACELRFQINSIMKHN